MNIDIIKPTAAVALADIARKMEAEGKKVIKLQTGDPDFSTHPSIIEAANKALLEGNTHYSFSQGLPILRKKIAAQYGSELGISISQEQILISNGAAEGFFSVMAALIEPGDEVILLEPNWPTVDSLVLLMGGVPVKISSLETNEKILSKLNESYSAKTKMVCFNTPNNPTGIVLQQDLIDTICNWAIEKKIYIVADEVYKFLQFSKSKTSSISFLDRYPKYIYINSFSKKFAMTGWRIGYIIAEEKLVKRILKPSQLAITNVAAFIQYAALEALENEASKAYCHEMLNEYEERRNQIVLFCDSLNIKYIYPNGAFYLFIKLPDSYSDDLTFCNRSLHEFQTCIVPGSAFGKAGAGYVRISFANSLETVKAGLKQIKELMNTL